MKTIDRRKFISHSLQTTAALAISGPLLAAGEQATPEWDQPKGDAPGIIDTNINLFEWPFRTLKYGTSTETLVKKLRRHRIVQAWAGSFEALFSKNIDLVNSRLVEACQKNGKGMLLPFGTVNPSWPDWEEDLRRCHEVHRMVGIRIYPIYQMIDLGDPLFTKLFHAVSERGMILQIVGDVEDARHLHPIMEVRPVSFDPLLTLLKERPQSKVQLLHWNGRMGQKLLNQLVEETSVALDISRLESTGAVGRLMEGKPWGGSATPVPLERILFGSHAPYFPVEAALLRLFESPLSREQMTAIMHENAERFLHQS